jgi:hypothetical protein
LPHSAHFDALKGDERNKTLVFALLGRTITFLKLDISILRWKLSEHLPNGCLFNFPFRD